MPLRRLLGAQNEPFTHASLQVNKSSLLVSPLKTREDGAFLSIISLFIQFFTSASYDMCDVILSTHYGGKSRNGEYPGEHWFIATETLHAVVIEI